MTSRATSSVRPSGRVAALSSARSSVTSRAASALVLPAAPLISSRAKARTSSFPRRPECSCAWITPSPRRSPAPATPRPRAAAAEASLKEETPRRDIATCPRAAHDFSANSGLPTSLKLFVLLLREVRIRFHFIDLLGVPFAVRRDEQDKLVPIQLSHRAVRHVIAQARRGF